MRSLLRHQLGLGDLAFMRGGKGGGKGGRGGRRRSQWRLGRGRERDSRHQGVDQVSHALTGEGDARRDVEAQ